MFTPAMIVMNLFLFIFVILLSCIGMELLKIRRLLQSFERTSLGGNPGTAKA